MSHRQYPNPRQDRRGIGRAVVKYPKLKTIKPSTANIKPIIGNNGSATRGRPVTTR